LVDRFLTPGGPAIDGKGCGGMDVSIERCAGLDVYRDTVVATVRHPVRAAGVVCRSGRSRFATVTDYM